MKEEQVKLVLKSEEGDDEIEIPISYFNAIMKASIEENVTFEEKFNKMLKEYIDEQSNTIKDT